MDISVGKHRSAVAVGTAASLVLSLIGGTVVLLFADRHPAPTTVALEPVAPPTATPPPAPDAPSAEEDPDLSMFGLGGDSAAALLGDGGTKMSPTPQSSEGPADISAFLPGAGGMAGGQAGVLPAGQVPGLPALPAMQLPPAGQLPAVEAVDFNALLAPIVAAQANANAANIANSVVGTSVGTAGAALNSAAILVGDLILFSLLSNNGQAAVSELQSGLTAAAATPGAVAALDTLAAAGVQLPPAPDLTGLTTAFAATAAAPSPFTMPALPGMPQLPAAPQLPTPDEALAGLASTAAGLSALAAALQPGLPPAPELPQLPKPEEVVGGVAGGIVALAVTGAVLGGIGAILQPPSLTRLMGLPF